MQPVSFSAQILITLGTVAYGAGPFVTDMNRTHLRHPAWPGHARLHLLWAASSQFLLSCVALWLVWSAAPDAVQRCRFAAWIGLIMTSGFWISAAFRKFYRGTLHDPQGIPPLGGKLDGNLVAVLAIDALLLAGILRL